uniref:NADH-ubiquinone oxidoreductase chain 3 n=1 Tax=Glossobalanus marginatus TaxID=1443200 RepID=A0A3S7SJD7_9BILA|nr:NADH dehydrogenase subunit 3 [Glossobalanus marginatus]AXZ97167.1 NADH dehydrogenase subunit 3 [Glossobalanus marginatus]
MNSFVVYLTIAALLSIVLSIVGHFLPTRNMDQEKLSPYECGFDPLASARLPFSLRFFLVAILFLLFDLEIALLLPLPAALSTRDPQLSFTLATLIITILTVGLIYEWAEGGLEWAE